MKTKAIFCKLLILVNSVWVNNIYAQTQIPCPPFKVGDRLKYSSEQNGNKREFVLTITKITDSTIEGRYGKTPAIFDKSFNPISNDSSGRNVPRTPDCPIQFGQKTIVKDINYVNPSTQYSIRGDASITAGNSFTSIKTAAGEFKVAEIKSIFNYTYEKTGSPGGAGTLTTTSFISEEGHVIRMSQIDNATNRGEYIRDLISIESLSKPRQDEKK